MKNIYDDITIHGKLRANKICGELSELTRKPLDDRINAVNGELQTAQSALAIAQETVVELAEKYNKAIEVINNLSERLTALESNYDPTVIQ